MARTATVAKYPPAAVTDALARFGRNIRIARLRRRLTQRELGRRVGVSRFVVADLERRKPSTGIAAYLGALWVLGILDQVVDEADPDRDTEGVLLERLRGPQRGSNPRPLDDDF